MSQPVPPLIEIFKTRYGHPPTLVARAPGRVNLIGEHTDYNDGFVLPIAIDRDTVMVGAPSDAHRARVYTASFDEESTFDLDALERSDAESWSNYIRGALWALREAGYPLSGFDAVLSSDVPLAAGLSSSAALEIATLELQVGLGGLALDAGRMAQLGQRAENDFVEVSTGIMDQLISAGGVEGHAVLIDCRSLERTPVPMPAGVAVVVTNSMVQRGLVDSAYGERRRQCEEGARLLGVPALRDVTPAMFEQRAGELPELTRRRCEHVVMEDARTLDAADALRAGDMAAVGRLLGESHASMRDLFEITVPPIDTLVELAQADPACIGSRMTGGGFGGCTVSLVRAKDAETFGERLAAAYAGATGLNPAVYICRPAAGSSHRAL